MTADINSEILVFRSADLFKHRQLDIIRTAKQSLQNIKHPNIQLFIVLSHHIVFLISILKTVPSVDDL